MAICGAVDAAFKADPDPDCKRAEKYDDDSWQRRKDALEMATARAETLESVKAKAAIVPVVLRQASNLDSANLEMQEMKFIQSVGDDTAAMIRKWFIAGNYQAGNPPDEVVPIALTGARDAA